MAKKTVQTGVKNNVVKRKYTRRKVPKIQFLTPRVGNSSITIDFKNISVDVANRRLVLEI